MSQERLRMANNVQLVRRLADSGMRFAGLPGHFELALFY
jgi:hypothetical protein